MKILQYSCTLCKYDILNVKSATEGNNQTLDFIPGNNFLGIVAGELYSLLKPEESLIIFHSGKVRFGDAHPEIDGKRALRVPASMYYPKLKKPSDVCYIHHVYDREKDTEDSGEPQQLKQCRAGFYIFEKDWVKEVEVKKSFAIKSAYNRELRRSKDEAMFGYESLDKGMTFLFEIAADEDVDTILMDKIHEAICGEKRIGRSRTAQFGLVFIEPSSYIDKVNYPVTSDSVYIYADSRLIFLDNNGLPTFQPTIKDFGLDAGTINWKKSQIRTFQYAPWNFKRRASDADRCGIEKGSVIAIEQMQGALKPYVGSYQNEGFGKIIVNPDFLETDPQTNGESKFKFEKKTTPVFTNEAVEFENVQNNPLFLYLNSQIRKNRLNLEIYEMVNTFVKNHKEKFISDSKAFASQWGTIRNIAMTHKSLGDLKWELFDKTITRKVKNNEEQEKQIPAAYLTHGVAKDKWDERGRFKVFKEFFEKLTDENAQWALINLSAEMAKVCRKEERQ